MSVGPSRQSTNTNSLDCNITSANCSQGRSVGAGGPRNSFAEAETMSGLFPSLSFRARLTVGAQVNSSPEAVAPQSTTKSIVSPDFTSTSLILTSVAVLATDQNPSCPLR